MDSQILEFCPLLNPDETEWLFRYAPVVVKKKEIKKLFKKEYYYEIGEIEESYRRELISEYTADCKKNICSKKVLSGLLKKGLENTRILDNSGRESAYLMKAVEVCKDPKLRLAINLAFACSLRIGELLGLTWSCIDISDESIHNGAAYVYVNKELQRVERSAMQQLDDKDVIFAFPIISSPKPSPASGKFFFRTRSRKCCLTGRRSRMN